MANPQCEHGYTRIANEIMEALAKNRLSGQERQILDVVLRKTYGFNKLENAISMSLFSELTGIKRPKVAKLIKSLLSKRILSVTQKDNSNTNCYSFLKDYEQWRVLSKRILGVAQKDNRLLSKRVTEGVIQKDTHKRNNTKETLKENTFVEGQKPFDLAVCFLTEVLKNNPLSRLHRLSDKEKASTIQRWAKDINLLLSKDKQEPSIVEEVIRFATNDNFWGANILSGRKLREKWDTLVTRMKTKGKGISKPLVNEYSARSSQYRRAPKEELSAEERLTSEEVKALKKNALYGKETHRPNSINLEQEQNRKKELLRQAKELIA